MARLHRSTRPHHRRRSSNPQRKRRRSGSLCAPGHLRAGLAIIALLALSASSGAQASPRAADGSQRHAGSAAIWRSAPLIGLRDAIPIDSEHAGTHVAQLWQQFQSLQSLHHALNWSSPIDVYALYTGFDLDSTVITLTIGYLEAALLRQAHEAQWVRQLIPAGRYVNLSTAAASGHNNDEHAMTPETSVRRGWQGLTGNGLPAAILERYHLRADGSMHKAEVLVLYH